MAVSEQLKPTADLLCAQKIPANITELKAIIQYKLDNWLKPYKRKTNNKNSLIQQANYLRINAFPMNERTKAELITFQTYVNGLTCT